MNNNSKSLWRRGSGFWLVLACDFDCTTSLRVRFCNGYIKFKLNDAIILHQNYSERKRVFFKYIYD